MSRGSTCSPTHRVGHVVPLPLALLAVLAIGATTSVTVAAPAPADEPAAAAASAEPTAPAFALHGLFTDHMVLQRDLPVPVWGTAPAGTNVTVEWRSETRTATADDAGRWRVTLPPTLAGGPYTLVARAGAAAVEVRDVLVGEVWLCSGQSNMAWTVAQSEDAEQEQVAADFPRIRMLTVPTRFVETPQTELQAAWVVCTPETVGAFSAAGYFFGRYLHQELDVPVGLVNSSVGGTRIEPWMPRGALVSDPRFAARVQELETAIAAFDPDKAADKQAAAETAYVVEVGDYWRDTHRADGGIAQGWADGKGDDSDWAELPLKGAWEQSGLEELAGFDGSVWLRTTVEIPDSWTGRDLRLHLPAIDDSDATYFNGEPIGRTTYQWTKPRNYKVPGKIVHPGPATIAVCAVDYMGAGGFASNEGARPDSYRLEVVGDVAPKSVRLDVPWRYRIGQPMSALPQPPRRPELMTHPGRAFTAPMALYNGMVAPLVPYGLRGAIWYQGESNAGQAEEYRTLLPLLIDGWRQKWQQPGEFSQFAFGVVQLANYLPEQPDEPAPGGWAWLRDAQLHVARTHPHAGLAVIIDIGDARDIHPKNKQEVGRRLGLWALATVYGRDLPHSGPVFTRAERAGDRMVLHFEHIADGLKTADGGPVRELAIAGEDRRFVRAEGRIVGDTVEVQTDGVPEPVAVRYAWANNPARANLVNSDGLPASPFRTDTWEQGSSPTDR